MTTTATNGAGSTGNIIAAVCTAFFPGLGHLVQGRILAALLFASVFWSSLWLGYILILPWFVTVVAWIWAVISTARYRPAST